jgi:hypothetical protein
MTGVFAKISFLPVMLAAALAAAALAAAAAAGSARAAACSTQGLVFSSGYRVARLVTDRIPCAKARAIARKVGAQLASGRSVDVPGTSALSLSTQTSCASRCSTETQVSLAFARGKVTVTLRGGAGAGPEVAPGGGTVV